MLQQQVYIINTILMALDALCIIAAGYGALHTRLYLADFQWGMETAPFVASVMAVMFVNNYVMGRLNLYGETRQRSFVNMSWNILKSILVDFAVLSAAVYLLQEKEYSRMFLGLFAAYTFLFIVFERLIVKFYFVHVSRKGFNTRRILIVGNKERAGMVSEALERQLSWGHQIVGRQSLDCDGGLCAFDLAAALKEGTIDEVVFALDDSRAVNLPQLIGVCRKTGIPCRILPAMWQMEEARLSIETCQGMPFITFQTDSFNATGLMYKRILDIVGGLVGTVLFLLIFPFVAAAIKYDSPGSVIFKQKRMGRHGRVFQLYKFRTMVENAEALKEDLMRQNQMKGAIFKVSNDPRITTVGKWLRKTSLDEFPQFLNVLKGEMSLVGTRPPTLEEVDKYELEHLKRISAKPGITGLWQVSGRNRIEDFEKIVELDCRYLENWRFIDDLKILLRTVFVVLQRKGAI